MVNGWLSAPLQLRKTAEAARDRRASIDRDAKSRSAAVVNFV
jgi:hypothetical protein